MSFVALTNFITITNPSGSVANIPDKFQNGRHTAISGFKYLSFIYQGATRSKDGSNLESTYWIK